MKKKIPLWFYIILIIISIPFMILLEKLSPLQKKIWIIVSFIFFIILIIREKSRKKKLSLKDAVNKIEEDKLLEKVKQFIQNENYTEAFSYLKQASSIGSVQAMYWLGRFYLEGKGIDRNPTKAYEYFSEAGEKGYPKALYELGMFYLNGQVVEKYLSKAEKYIKEAAQKGDQRALDILDKMGIRVKIEKSFYNDEVSIMKESLSHKGILKNMFISTFLLAIFAFCVAFILGTYILYQGYIDSYQQDFAGYSSGGLLNKCMEMSFPMALIASLIETGIGFICMLIAYSKPRISSVKYALILFFMAWISTFVIFTLENWLSSTHGTNHFWALTIIYLIAVFILGLFIKLSKKEKPIF